MSDRVSVSASVVVAAPSDQAFDELIDAAGQARWMLGTTVHPVAGEVEAPDVGAALVAFTGFAGLGVLDTMLVTELEPGRRWVVAHRGSVIAGSGVFQVEPVGSGSRVTWTEDLTLPFGIVGRVGWPLVRPLVRWGLQRSLVRFADLFGAGAR